jgi:hypothetical protein
VGVGTLRQERNLIDVPNPEDSANPYAPKFNHEDPTGKTLIIPVFFLHPEHATSDAVPEFVEDTTFGANLAVMSPRDATASSRQPWDTEGKYMHDGSLVVYAMTSRRRLLKVGWKMTPRDVCRAAGGGIVGPDGKGDGLEVKDGCLSFVVVPKGEVERKKVEEYKSVQRH